MQFNSADINSKLANYKFAYSFVSLDSLQVDLRVQQPLREGKVRAMLRRGYDASLAGVITVSERSERDNNARVILDGQTRAETARRSGETQIYAQIWYDLPLALEAWLFTYLNEKSNPSAISRFKTRITAEEEVPVAIAKILSERGWTITDAKKSSGNFAAVTVAERIYLGQGVFKTRLHDGRDVFAWTIDTITEAWGLNRTGSDGSVLSGVALFLVRYWDRIDGKKVVSALSRMTPERFRAEALDVQKSLGVSPPLAFGYKIHQEYNKRTRSKLTPFAV